MFDFLRNLPKTEEEKRQERLSAYLDNALTSQQRQAFEKELDTDTTLQASLEQQRLLKQNLSQMPRMRAPRSFTLDPAAYGRPAPQPAFTLYPILRGATALAAILLIFLFTLEWVSPTLDEETVAQVPALSTSAELDESADSSEETAAEEPLEEAEPGVFSEGAGEAAPTIEEVAEEEAVEEAEEAVEESGLAPAPEPAEDTDAPFNENATDATIEAEAQEGGADGGITVQIPSPTTTLRTSPTTTVGLEGDTLLYSTTESIPTTPSGEGVESDQTTIPPIRFLQYGLGILFLLLLAATWLVRRRL
jgi:hypothetical protein